MFTSKKSEALTNDREIRAFLEEGCEMEGRLQFSGVVRMNGRFRGEILSEDVLIVGTTATIEGHLQVGSLIVGGHVNGDVKARLRVEILATGFIEGTVESPALVTHEGGMVCGQVKVIKEPHGAKRAS
jgi:cytoskeletal protein CcmA (bactofilin family)